MGNTYHLIMGDQDHVQPQGSFLANLSLRPDVTRYRLEMGSKHGKKCNKSTVHTAALNPRNPWLSPALLLLIMNDPTFNPF
jgi:hypothetical protein